MTIGLVAMALAPVAATGAGFAPVIGRALFDDPREPPAYRHLRDAEAERFDLGHAVFNTQWVEAGTEHAERRDGLGPLFNASSCDECHNEGAHGRGPVGDGAVPQALIVQLDRPRSAKHAKSPDAEPAGMESPAAPPPGDAIYGHVLNTRSLNALQAEGTVSVHYREIAGRYPDGSRWSLRAPRYDLTLLRGPLNPATVLRPRLAPALFGVGLLDAVNEPGIARRFGWQAVTRSVREQTTRALSREIGITSSDVPTDDCTSHERDCRSLPSGGAPEASPELLDALLAFQEWLAVPQSPLATDSGARGAALFLATGCTSCHRERFVVSLEDEHGMRTDYPIEPYTDLKTHDLGSALADRDVSGRAIPSRWRTAPLWGLGYRLHSEHVPTFLHDGRARSLEEAILWHGGEANPVRRRFQQLGREQRGLLVGFLEGL
ncbi:MAG TPA: di-heme oxidoredictase family protein [Steroidobacteraceae bacterium]|nr:di-heme oxidoredictase family protein [Steroidobacteraceae bacterium]